VMIAADVMVKPFVEMGHVQRVLAGWIGGEYELNAVFPRGHTQSPKVRAFVDFLLERLNLEIDYMTAHCPLMLAKEQCMASQGEESAEEAETAAVGLRILEAAMP
ncbi:MAG: LysR family transcriptional regulator, partial [Burkholderiales bacterium]